MRISANNSSYPMSPKITGLVTTCLFIALTFIVSLQEGGRYREELQAQVTSKLSQVRARLENEINRHFHLTRGLLAFVALNPDLDVDTFRGMAQEILLHATYIKNIGLAPHNILRFVHPVKGNEKAIGLDYSKNTKQWPAVKTAIENRHTVVAGPVDLVQGGKAFISRTPIYVTKSSGEKGRYWGLASIVIDLDGFFQAAGMAELDGSIRLAMRGQDGKGAEGGLIFGDENLFVSGSVFQQVHLPNGSWQLSAEPKLGWEEPSPLQLYIWSIGILIALLSGWFVRVRLERSVKIRLLLEKALLDAQIANKAKSNFLAHMSHEIRTPLNAILGMNEVLRESDLSEEQRKHLQISKNAGETLLALINDVLDLSKIEAGQIDLAIIDFNLYRLIENTSEIQTLLAHEKGIDFDVELDPKLPMHVKGDPDRLRQILLNLLNNAIKFTSSGGVVFSVAQLEDNLIQFTVRDTGIGISEKQVEQIFKPFVQADSTTTRNFGGTGLGLTICKQLVEALGGTIELESQLGVGSIFRLHLPLPPSVFRKRKNISTGADMPNAPSKTASTKKILTILLVDDAEENLMVITAYIGRSHHHIIEAEDGAQAVAIYKEKKIDLILMDMMMPIMDGYDATRAIREHEKQKGLKPVPIIALTAQALKEDLDKTLDAGCNLHLTKPVSKTRLIAAIDRFRH
ncbi:MAG: response regulator [Magnetococcales bacterium]|nr:response regulator [Magnetococcales bacterium]